MMTLNNGAIMPSFEAPSTVLTDNFSSSSSTATDKSSSPQSKSDEEPPGFNISTNDVVPQQFVPMPKRTVPSSILHSLRGNDGTITEDSFINNIFSSSQLPLNFNELSLDDLIGSIGSNHTTPDFGRNTPSNSSFIGGIGLGRSDSTVVTASQILSGGGYSHQAALGMGAASTLSPLPPGLHTSSSSGYNNGDRQSGSVFPSYSQYASQGSHAQSQVGRFDQMEPQRSDYSFFKQPYMGSSNSTNPSNVFEEDRRQYSQSVNLSLQPHPQQNVVSFDFMSSRLNNPYSPQKQPQLLNLQANPFTNKASYNPQSAGQAGLGHNVMRSASAPCFETDLNPRGLAQHAGRLPGNTPTRVDVCDDIVVNSCREILSDASSNCLKAVELANTLRARVGTEVLAHVREVYGGLLSLLERHQYLFRVDRIPKNDIVTLVSGFVSSTSSPGSAQGRSITKGPSNADLQRMLGEAQDADNQVSRCLHIGNVPNNLSDAQLILEFERYGRVDGLKLVSQRNRRFAFVSFRSVDEAVTAKKLMSRVYPWKSAVSFSRKESTSSGYVSGNKYALGSGGGSYQSLDGLGSKTQHSTLRNSSSGDGLHGRGLGGAFDSDSDLSLNGLSISRNVSSNSIGLDYEHQQLHSGDATFAQQSSPQLAWQQPGAAYRSDAILQRLCDDTYVPTQAWPIDAVQDSPYVSAVVATLEQFSGQTTISKLRGFLRNRLAAHDNIKSVPLKSLLRAYPHLFVLQGNQVLLMA